MEKRCQGVTDEASLAALGGGKLLDILCSDDSICSGLLPPTLTNPSRPPLAPGELTKFNKIMNCYRMVIA